MKQLLMVRGWGWLSKVYGDKRAGEIQDEILAYTTHAVNHHQELINRLENLVNVLDTVLPAKDEDVRGILEAVVFTRNEARETLKKVKK